MSTVKQLIASLESWLAETEEKLAALFVKEEKQPTLISLLNDYSSIRKAEHSTWSNSARQKGAVLDVKFNAEAFMWMQSVGVTTLEDFENLIAAQKPILDKISGNDKQVRRLNKSIEHIENFKKYALIHAESKKGFEKKRAKYAAEHKPELDAFSKAVRYLRANNLTADDLGKCRSQRDALRTENQELRAELAALKLDPDMICSIQHCVDTVLKHKGEIPEEKTSVLDRITANKEALQATNTQPPRKRTEQER